MFWIKTAKGGLVNLATATDVKVATEFGGPDKDKDVKLVRVFFVSGGDGADWTDVFSGTKEECYRYLDALTAELSKTWSADGPAFHEISVERAPQNYLGPDVPF